MAEQNLSLGLRISLTDTNTASGVRAINSEISSLGQRANQSSAAINNMSGGLGRIKDQFVALAVTAASAFAVSNIVKMADTWTNLEGRLRLVTASSEELRNTQNALFTSSNANHVGLESTIELYAKMARNQKELNVTTQEMISLVDTIGKTLVISGGSAESANMALIQFSQSMGSGILNGEEFRSVGEQTPRLLRAIAEGWQNLDGTIGTTGGKLRALALNQELTMDKVIPAIQRAGKSVAYEFSQMPLTIGQSLTVAENHLLKFIGVTGQTSGAAHALATSIVAIGENIDSIVATVLGAAGAWIVYKTAMLGVGFVEFIGRIQAGAVATVAHTEALAINNTVNLERAATERTVALAVAQSAEATASSSLITINAQRAQLQYNAQLITSNLSLAQSELASATSTAAKRAARAEVFQLTRDSVTAQSALNASITAQTAAQARYTTSIAATSVAQQESIAANAAMQSGLTALYGETGALTIATAQQTVANKTFTLSTAQSTEAIALESLAQINNNRVKAESAVASARSVVMLLEEDRARALATASITQATVANQRLITANATLTAVEAERNAVLMAQTGAQIEAANASRAVTVANAELTTANTALATSQAASATATTLTARSIVFFKSIIPALRAELTALNAVAIANPYAVVITAIVAAGTALYLYRDKLIEVNGTQAEIRDYAQVAWNKITGFAEFAWQAISNEINTRIERIKTKFSDLVPAWFDTLNDMINGVLAMGKTLINTFIGIEKSIGDILINPFKDWSTFDFSKTLSTNFKTDYLSDMGSAVNAVANDWSALAGGIKKTRDEAEALAKQKDLANKLSLQPQELRGLNFNKKGDELLAKYNDDLKKATLSARELGIEEIKATGAAGKEYEFLVGMLDKKIAAESVHKATIEAKTVSEKTVTKAVNEAANAQKALQTAYQSTIETLKNEGNELDTQLQAFSLTKGELSDLKNEYYGSELAAKGYTYAMIAQSLQLRANNEFTREKIGLLKAEYDAMSGLIDKNIELSQQTVMKNGVRVANPNADADAAIAKLQSQGITTDRVKSLMEANQRLEERNQAVKYGADITRQLNAETAIFNENMGQAAKALNAGTLSQADFNKYLAQQHDLMFANSAAGKQEKEFFDSLDKISQAGFTAMVQNGASATEAMTSMFKNMADNMTASLMDVGRKSLIDWVKNGEMAAGGWLNVITGAVAVGVNLVGSLFTRAAPMRTASASETANTSTELGSGAMQIVDSVARDQGFNYASTSAALFNQNIATFTGILRGNTVAIIDYLGQLGSKLAATQPFQVVSNLFGKVGNGLSYVFDVIGKGVDFVKSGFSSVVNWVAKAGESLTSGSASATGGSVATTAADKIAAEALQKTLGKVFAVVGAVYSIYSYVTTIGDIIDKGTVGQAVGATLEMVGSLTMAASLFTGPAAPIVFLAGLVASIAGFFTSLFSEAHKPIMGMRLWGQSAAKIGEITSSHYPKSGGGIVQSSSKLGTTQFENHYRGSLNESQMVNTFTPLLNTITTVDNVIADAVNKMDGSIKKTGATVRYFKQNVGYFVTEQNLQDVNVSAMLAARYDTISALFKASGTKAGTVFSLWYDALRSKFYNDGGNNTAAVFGIAHTVAANIEAFSALPTELATLMVKSIKGISLSHTTEQVSSEINAMMVSFSLLDVGLQQLNIKLSNTEIVSLLDKITSTGTPFDIATTNLLSYPAALDKLNGTDKLTRNDLVDKFSTNESMLSNHGFSSDQKSAFYGSFGLLTNLFADAGINITGLKPSLEQFALSIDKSATASSQAANEAINHAIAEQHLTAVTRDSAIATLIKTKVIDEATATQAQYGFAVAKVTKDLLNGIGFIQSFGVAVGKTMGSLGVSALTLFNAGQNVVKVFGDMDKANAFFDRTTKSFLTPEQQASVAARIADNNVKSLLAANASLSSISVTSIQDMLLKGTGLADFIAAFAQGNGEKAQVITNYIDALGAQLAANNALTDSLGNMKTVANDVQKYLDSLKLNNELTTLNPAQRLAETRQQFTTTLASANDGNTKAAGNLTTVADAYLKEARSFFASSPEYTAVFSAVTSALKPFTLPAESKKALKPIIDGSHRNGLDYVPFDGYVAQLHQGERVQTKEQVRRDDSKNNDAELREMNRLLKEQNELLKQQIQISRFGFKGMIDVEEKVVDALDGVEQQLWKQAVA